MGDISSNLWDGLRYTAPVPDLDREVEARIYETSHEPAETEANGSRVIWSYSKFRSNRDISIAILAAHSERSPS